MKLYSRKTTSALHGTFTPPGDKSISHRALIFGALAKGTTRISGLLRSEDVKATAKAIEQLGTEIIDDGETILVHGQGAECWQRPAQPLDMGNSGTAMRLLAGVLAGQPFDSVLTGDESLNARPMKRIMRPLRKMGGSIEGTTGDTAPLRIRGARLMGIDYESPVASAQVKSCVLLAGLYATGLTRVSEPMQSRDHTERMLQQFGVQMDEAGFLPGGSVLTACDVGVPADISSAAFAIAAAMIVPDSQIMLRNVGVNPSRTGFLETVAEMGADIKLHRHDTDAAEPVADIEVRFNGRLKAVCVPEDRIPSMVDEVPVLMVLAALADGTSRIRGAAELRVKESDRLQVMGDALSHLGVPISLLADGVDITGVEIVHSAEALESAGDHRCAMSFSILAMRSREGLTINDAEFINTSYPEFVDQMTALGASMAWEAQV